MRTYILLLCIVSIALAGRRSDFADSVLTASKAHLKEKNYEEAEKVAKMFVEEYGRGQENEFIVPLLLEAYVQQGKFSPFNRILGKYKKRFPESKEFGRIYYLEGIAHAKQKSFLKAFDSFNKSMQESGSESKRVAILKKNCDKLLTTYLSIDEIEDIDRDKLAKSIMESYDFYYGIRMKENNTEKATKLLVAFKQAWPTSELDTALVLHNTLFDTPEVKTTTQASQKRDFSRSIALMIPMTSTLKRDKKMAELALRSVELALSEYSAVSGDTIKLELIDTKGNGVVTAREMKKLIEKGASTIIGPINSVNATVAASMLIEHPDIVMVTPTATDEGIAGLGENIFQINITPKAVADKIATYAVNTLGIKSFASLAPLNEYGNLMTEFFKRKVEELGATMEVSEYYVTTSNDHRKQFEKIRRHFGTKRLNLPDTVETLNSSQRASVERFVEKNELSIGGFFIPALKADNAVKIAAEVPFHKIKTQLLGSNSWNSNTLILDGGAYVNKAIFATGYSADNSSTEWKNFNTRYITKYSKKPDRMVTPLCYDAAKIVLDALSKSQSSEDVIREIKNVESYNGLSGVITIDNVSGANSGIVVKKVSGKRFIRLE